MSNWKRTFAIIWSGQFISLLTSYTVNFAIILWMSIETGSASILAYAAIAAMLPQAAIGPITGVLIDRWNRKSVMIIADTYIALVTLALAVLFWLEAAEMWHILAMLALRSVGSAFHMPAMQASVPLIAPESQLTRIAGINQIISSTCNIAGPVLGAIFITWFALEYVLLFDVVGAALACISLLFVTIPNPEKNRDKTPNIFREMKEGILVVWDNRGLRWVFIFAILCYFFIVPISVLFPLMTLDYFGGGKYHVSLIEVLWGAGALAGGAIMGAKVYKINKVILINIMFLITGTTFIIPGLLSSSGFAWFAVMTTLGGIAGAVYHAAFTSLLQTIITPAVLGRVFSMYFTLGLLPSMLGLIGIGFFADNLGLTASFVLCGAAITLIGIIAFMTPSALRLDRDRQE